MRAGFETLEPAAETVREPSAALSVLPETMRTKAETLHGNGEHVHAPPETADGRPETMREASAHARRLTETVGIKAECSGERPEVLQAVPELRPNWIYFAWDFGDPCDADVRCKGRLKCRPAQGFEVRSHDVARAAVEFPEQIRA